MKDFIARLLAWRPTMPGVSVSGVPAAIGRGIAALWRSFWAVWGNPMTYPIVGALVVLAFVVGFGEGHRSLGRIKAELASERATLAQTKGDLSMTLQRAQTAEGEVKRLTSKLETIASPAPVAGPPRAKRTAVPKKASDKPWWSALGGG